MYLCSNLSQKSNEMIAYVKGHVAYKTPTFVIVDVGGIGYRIHISLYTYARIEKLETVKLLTHFHVKEDSQTLYGFSDNEERQLFIHLISVSGIGPNTARILLSSISPEEARSAIIGENIAVLNSVKGIGPKTAKRLVVELKDKLMKETGGDSVLVAVGNNTLREEALSALVTLGFNRARVQKAIKTVMAAEPSTANAEVLIKLALKKLS